MNAGTQDLLLLTASFLLILGGVAYWLYSNIEAQQRKLGVLENVLYELPRSTSWLATAGSGDVLAGIIGSIVATNAIEILNDANRLAEVAAAGALIHLLAADSASNGGPISAQQIIPKISKTISQMI